MTHHSEPAREAVALLPCPFCGGAPSVSTRQDESLWSHNTVTKTQVRCDECDISFETEPGYEFEAPEAWNRRHVSASPAPAAGGLEAVREAVGDIAAFDSQMQSYADVGYFDGAELAKTWKDQAAPAIERIRAAALASPAATSGPTYVVNCCNCGRIIDTREESEGGDQWGHELSDDRWVCSPECLDAVTDPDAVPAATSAETQGGDGVWEVAELLSHLKLYVLEKLDPDDADALHDRMGDLTAALAPSTAAATRGEAVGAEPELWSPKLEAIRLLDAEDKRQLQILDLLETIREQIRLGVKPEHRPEGLMKNMQNAVYALRGRLALLNDAAIMAPLRASPPAPAVESAQVADMAMLIRMLVRNMSPGLKIRDAAVDYLKRHRLQGSPLRASLDLATDAEG